MAFLEGLGLGSALGAFGMGSSAMQFFMNRSLMREQQQWQEKMSNTAHQREVEDLKAAGLNPILSATGGSGASTPSCASTRVDSPRLGLESYLQYLVGKQNANSATTQAAAAKVNADANMINAQTNASLRDSQIDLNSATAQKITQDARILNSGFKSLDYNNQINEIKNGIELDRLRTGTGQIMQSLESNARQVGNIFSNLFGKWNIRNNNYNINKNAPDRFGKGDWIFWK